MDVDELKRRLRTMEHDLSYSKRGISERMALIRSSTDDRDRLLMDLYAKDYSPVKVTSYDGIPSGRTDEDRMISFSSGFQQFYETMEADTRRLIILNTEARSLLKMIMKLGYPFSNILYMRFMEHLNHNSIASLLFLSRPTYFRYYKKAMKQLAEMVNAREHLEP